MTCYGLLAVSLRSNIPRSFEGEGLLSPLIWGGGDLPLNPTGSDGPAT